MRYLKELRRACLLIFYRGCLYDTVGRILDGEQHLELSRRFFRFKVHKYSKTIL